MLPNRTRTKLIAAALAGAAAIGAMSGIRSRRDRRIGVAVGLDDTITVNRDKFGIPHIVAASWQDAMFGMGYAIAEDRLWQMDVSRRVAMGKLSEVIGPNGLDSDCLMRLLGMQRIAHRLVAAMSDDERTACERFAAGVNHYIDTNRLPLEFRVFRYEPASWTPADSVAIFRLLAWTLSGSIDADLTAEQLRKTIGDDWTEVIYRGGFQNQEPVVRQHTGSSGNLVASARRLPVFPQFGASNAWAVNAEHSVTGGALLANDPHLELRNPSIWSEARIEAPGFRVSGVTVPGIPAIVIGRTPEIAWGVTAGMTPQVFLYDEDHQDDERFQTRIHHEVIAVKDRPDEVMTIRYTPRGPLISDLIPQPDGQSVSLHWTGMEEGHELGVLLDAARASTVDEALPLFRQFTSPPLCLALADSKDNIASACLGRMAIRDHRPGLLAATAFPPEYVDPEDLPIEQNPERGWLVCANNRLVDGDYPHQIHGNWAPGFRYRRIANVLSSRPRHSPADFRLLQIDTYSVHAADIVPVLVGLLHGAVASWIITDLEDWDFEMSCRSRAALLFETIHREWARLALLHRLPPGMVDQLMTRGGALSVPVSFVDRVLQGELPAWIQDDARAELAAHAVEHALAWLSEQLGPDTDSWHWGALHRVAFRHPLGRIPGPHRRRVNIGPISVPGSRYTVLPMVWSDGDRFDVFAGPSMRYVTDLKRPELGWITNTLGQSGSPLSRHFRDQIEDFLTGFVHPLWPEGFHPRSVRTILPTAD